MSKVIEVNYQGKYQSATKTHFNQEPAVTVNASRFTPVDLMALAYCSCLMATIDFATQKKVFKPESYVVKLVMKWLKTD